MPTACLAPLDETITIEEIDGAGNFGWTPRPFDATDIASAEMDKAERRGPLDHRSQRVGWWRSQSSETRCRPHAGRKLKEKLDLLLRCRGQC